MVEQRDSSPLFCEELMSGSVCLVAIPRHMPRSLQEMLSCPRNDPSEARERGEGGGICRVRRVEEWQGVYPLKVGEALSQ